MKYRLVYNHFSKWVHTSILLAGCTMLSEQGLADFEFHNCAGDPRYPSKDVCGAEIIINGTPVYFDCADGYIYKDVMLQNLQKYPYYFKRSFNCEENEFFGEYKHRIYSLGLNYQVYAHASQKDLFVSASGSKVRASFKKYANRMAALRKTVKTFEKPANDIAERTPQICFMARLWDSAATIDEKDYINATRIDLIRRIKKEYPSNSYCYVSDNDIARRMCPDLIAGKFTSSQPFYLKKMQSSDICIGTMGLFKSIGWKTAEYVAASRAVVQEKMYYSPPGGFAKDKNYLEFGTPDECMSAIEKLMTDKQLLLELKKNNEDYYRHFVSPDKQILNAIKIVTGDD